MVGAPVAPRARSRTSCTTRAPCPDELWDELAAEWEPPQLVELVATAGFYHLVSFTGERRSASSSRNTPPGSPPDRPDTVALAARHPEAVTEHRREYGIPTALVAGAGHSPMVEQPAETARLLLKFDRDR